MTFNQIYNIFKRFHNHMQQMKYPFHPVQTHRNLIEIIPERKKLLREEKKALKIEVKKAIISQHHKRI